MKQTERDILLFMETSNGQVCAGSLELITAAGLISNVTGGKILAVLLGNEVDVEAGILAHYSVDKVICVKHSLLENYSTIRYTNVLETIVRKYRPDVLMLSATRLGKDLAPRLARRIRTGITANCTELDVNQENGVVSWKMPAPGGVIATILCNQTRPQMGTICPGIFMKPTQNPKKTADIIYEQVDVGEDIDQLLLIQSVYANNNPIKLSEAEIVVAGGRGMGDKEGFQMVYDLAHSLGAAVGASRAAVDSGLAKQECLIGQTGSIIRPRLYVACGISGALQHMIGAEKAACIVAINNDKTAPILKYADYAIIGDVKQIIPVLVEHLNSLGK